MPKNFACENWEDHFRGECPHCKGLLTSQNILDVREDGKRRGFCPHCGKEVSEYLATSQFFFLAF